MNLEKSFLIDNKKNGRFICIVGRKASGKSYLATNYLAISYKYKLYDEIHLIIPEFLTDNNSDTYRFIKYHENTYIYDTYNEDITNHIKEQSKTKRILYILDDATNYLFENKNKSQLLHLVSTCRHGEGVTVIVICHAIKNILLPAIRALVDHMFIGAFHNDNIIKHSLYEENLSLLISNYDEFRKLYIEKIIKQEHNFIYLNNKCEYDINVNKWALSKFDRKTLTYNNTEKYKVIKKDYKKDMMIKKALKMKEQNEINNKYNPKPEKVKKVFMRRLPRNII